MQLEKMDDLALKDRKAVQDLQAHADQMEKQARMAKLDNLVHQENWVRWAVGVKQDLQVRSVLQVKKAAVVNQVLLESLVTKDREVTMVRLVKTGAEVIQVALVLPDAKAQEEQEVHRESQVLTAIRDTKDIVDQRVLLENQELRVNQVDLGPKEKKEPEVNTETLEKTGCQVNLETPVLAVDPESLA